MRAHPLLAAFVASFFAVACGGPPFDDEGDAVDDVADDADADDDADDDDVVDADDVTDDPTLVTEATLLAEPYVEEAPDDEDWGLAAPEPAEEPDPLAATDAPVRARRLRVLAWNIAGGKENGCATAGIRRAVMRFVRDANGPVDVVALNEVCPAQFQAIRAALQRHWGKSDDAKFAAFVKSADARAGNALFSRRDLRKITRHELGQDQYGKRFLLCGRQVDRRVRVCAVHLTPGDVKARAQLGRVHERLERWWLEKRDTVIIGGDFNLRPDDPGMNKMYAAAADTPNNPDNHGRYREWDDDDSEHCRGYGAGSLPGGLGGPCGTGAKIDFIFARGNRIVDGAYSARALPIPDDCTGVCSDHRAIRGSAKLRYRVD